MAKNIAAEAACPACHRARSEWRFNNSQGYSKGGKTYCCEGCANGTHCTCVLLELAPRPLKNVDPT